MNTVSRKALDRYKLCNAIEDEIESLSGLNDDYSRGARNYNDSLLKEIQSGRFDLSTESEGEAEKDAKIENLRALAKQRAASRDAALEHALKKEREIAALRSDHERLRAALKELPDKIMQIDSFADVEELTFPMTEPTEEDQEEWLDTFLQRQREYVEALVEEALEGSTSEKIGEEACRNCEGWERHSIRPNGETVCLNCGHVERPSSTSETAVQPRGMTHNDLFQLRSLVHQHGEDAIINLIRSGIKDGREEA